MNWKYFIPIIIASSYVVLTEWGYFYLIFPLLFFANGLNLLWGEFKPREIKNELHRFYGTATGWFIKRCSAVLLAGYIIWSFSFVIRHDLSNWYIIGFATVSGILTGCFNITLAHDLLHSNNKTDKFLSATLLLLANIPHLAIDHVYGHHRTIGLKDDATTAKVNQGFYNYFFKTAFSRVYQVYFTGFQLPGFARKRILKYGIVMLMLQLVVWAIILWALPKGPQVFLLFVVQGGMSYFLYELINYIQHYGLCRKYADAPVTQQHSWNCYYKYTNYILYMLPLHSLHHLHKTDRKKMADSLTSGPRMPYLYFVMITLALIPPLWFKKMNPWLQQNIPGNEVE